MEKYKFFIQDLIVLLKERLERPKEHQLKSNIDYNKGVNMGIYETLDLIKEQANAFGIPLEDIGLDSYQIEKFL